MDTGDIAIVPSVPGPEGRGFDAYCVRPPAPRPPAILLLPEMFGLSPAMRESAESFAAQGHVVLAPNLFWREARPEVLGYEGDERDAANDRLAGLDIDRAVDDIGAAARALRDMAPGAPVVAIGHCIGGRLAVLAAARLKLDGAVSYYGLGLSDYPDEMRGLAVPVQLHYGLADPHVPLGEVEAVAALVAGNPKVELLRYADAGHSFVNPYRPMFDPPQAKVVAARSTALIEGVAAAPR